MTNTSDGNSDCCSGYYCTNASKCCETSQKWVTGVGCQHTAQCYNTPCTFAPFSNE